MFTICFATPSKHIVFKLCNANLQAMSGLLFQRLEKLSNSTSIAGINVRTLPFSSSFFWVLVGVSKCWLKHVPIALGSLNMYTQVQSRSRFTTLTMKSSTGRTLLSPFFAFAADFPHRSRRKPLHFPVVAHITAVGHVAKKPGMGMCQMSSLSMPRRKVQRQIR